MSRRCSLTATMSACSTIWSPTPPLEQHSLWSGIGWRLARSRPCMPSSMRALSRPYLAGEVLAIDCYRAAFRRKRPGYNAKPSRCILVSSYFKSYVKREALPPNEERAEKVIVASERHQCECPTCQQETA